MHLDLGSELERAATEPDQLAAREVVTAVRARTKQRTRRAIAVVSALVLLAATVLGGWLWWTNRPVPNSYGEPDPTAVWQTPPLLTREQAVERCGAKLGDPPYQQGNPTVTNSETGDYCQLGWERAPHPGGLTGELPNTAAAIRQACERVSGKDLTGWQLVNLTDPFAAPTPELPGPVVVALFRAANECNATCFLTPGETSSLMVEPAARVIADTPTGHTVGPGVDAALVGDEEKFTLQVTVRGPLGLDDRLARRATRLRVSPAEPLPACEVPVRNGHALGMCFPDVTRAQVDQSGNDASPNSFQQVPVTLDVLDRRGHVLTTVGVEG